MARPWMRGEEKYLRENYQTMTAKEIAGQLDRTENAINIKASRLGLRKSRDWTTSEIKMMQEIYMSSPGMTYKQLSEELEEKMGIHVSAENVRWHVNNRKIGDSDGSTA